MAAALTGLAQVNAALRKIESASPSIGRAATRAAAEVARRAIIAATPKRSGALASSVGVGNDDQGIVLGATVGYNVGDAPRTVGYAGSVISGTAPRTRDRIGGRFAAFDRPSARGTGRVKRNPIPERAANAAAPAMIAAAERAVKRELAEVPF